MSDEPAARALGLLIDAGQRLAVAESLTGGLVSAALTDVPGASRAFRGGVTAYATDLKSALLGVDEGLLATGGAVQPEVAGQMAIGARRLLNAEWGLATTGVAGPEPQDGAPVGTVFVAVAGPTSAAPVVEGLVLRGERGEIRNKSVRAALELLCARIAEHRGEPVGRRGTNHTEQNGGPDVYRPE
ncbi:CinA family protein [Streptomyces sp. XM4193]|uniref:CinA family protein n=1 Tax=Streptomyces sp. XM4193 TaxID=2929782 RepID=UPI001FF8249B|nr:CinA family protein [Streptomyces sp. XM4193]MCK1798773.1 CinA family protein [Streptomyces sp. XM4193]